ncbi:hypothetical protein NM688_g1650 [Phlebia brevispora]|uniref:Uncharacterized protein n=1 Tax=Phlebia brevispora TaxID=194682 RepID=A0ACC1TBI3_9APHY|nr:hypothetical protein NM688_g1650 [Phlebia brevispora]
MPISMQSRSASQQTYLIRSLISRHSSVSCTSDPALFTSPIWHQPPGEILAVVLNWLVLGCQAQRSLYSAKSLSLVCREWHRRFNPHVCRFFTPPSGIEGTDLLLRLRSSSGAYRYASDVTLIGVRNCGPKVIKALSTALSNASRLDLNNISWGGATCSHPLWGKLFASSWAGFKNVTRLEICGCMFSSSSDLLQMLAVLPALSYVFLCDIFWSPGQTFSVVPRRKWNKLEFVDAWRADAASLCYFWMLPHPRVVPGEASYPGFSYLEAQILRRMVGHLWPQMHTPMRITRSLYPDTWILHMHESMDITISLDANTGRGYIQWLVLRFRDRLSEIFQTTTTVSTIAMSISQLPHLRLVVMERAHGGDYAIPAEMRDLEDRIHTWSWDDALEYANSAKHKGISDDSRLPISPCWLDLLDEYFEDDSGRRLRGLGWKLQSELPE